MKIEQSGTPISNTTRGEWGKYAPGVADLFNSGNIFRVVVKPTWVKSTDKKALAKFLNYIASGRMDEALKLTFVSSAQGKEISFGQICKPKVGANMGDTAEGVFAAAIACRFVLESKRRGADIIPADVFKMLWDLRIRNGADKVSKVYEAPNKGITLKDDVELAIHLAPANLAFLVNRKAKAALESYAIASCKYANAPNVKHWAHTVYTNGTYDEIRVRASGIENQKTTKVDVYVEITNDQHEPIETDIHVSLKIDDVKQFGQKGGTNFEEATVRGRKVDGYKEYFTRLFGSDTISFGSGFKKKYEDAIEKKKFSEGVNMMYDKVYAQLNTTMNKTGKDGTKQRKKLFNTLGKALEYYATLGHAEVTLVQLSRRETRIYNFNGLANILATHKFKLEKKTGTSKETREPLPSIIIAKDGGEFDGMPLVIFRLKRENKSDGSGYYRNLVEKGSYMSELISTTIG